MSARQSIDDMGICGPSNSKGNCRVRRIAQFFGLRTQPAFAEIRNRVHLQKEGATMRDEVLPQGYVFAPNPRGDGVDKRTRRYGPRLKWRGTTASRTEGLISVSLVDSTGAITRLALDFEIAAKLRDSINAHLPALVKTPAVEVSS